MGRNGAALSAPADTAVPVPARVPASTIRGVRIFHRLSQKGFAILFQVSERTVYRWEEKGAVPSALPLDESAKVDPLWRRNLLIWMVERYDASAVADNRKKGG